MDLSDIGPGMIFGQRFIVLHEIARTEGMHVYAARDVEHDRVAVGLTIVPALEPDSGSALDAQVRTSLDLVRLSDFGSPSRRRLGRCRGRWTTCFLGQGSTYGVWYSAWEVNPNVLARPYRTRATEFSKTMRLHVLQRANDQCERCGRREGVQVDHVVPVAVGGTSDLANGMALCQGCHQAKTAVAARLLAVDALSVDERCALYQGLVDLHITGTPPYILQLPGHNLGGFVSQAALWQWLTRNARALLPLLPPAPNAVRWGLGVDFEMLGTRNPRR